MSFQQCRFNFGSEPFKYPPNRPFNNFNQNAVLKAQDKVKLIITNVIFLFLKKKHNFF